ncbi:DUF2235 domain-containing protein [Rhizobium ruizarguesonis]
MPKNLVVCCDGTANEFADDRTNVAKLCYCLIKDVDRQVVYYHPGVGTEAPPGFVTGFGTKLAKLAGLAFGYGLKRDVANAYIFIIDNYKPGDRLFIFGFSRGAYTARVVAALIHMYGVIMPGNDALVPYMIKMLWAINKARGNNDKTSSYFKLASDFKATLSGNECKPHFVGVWDTVSSVGWIGSPVSLPYTRDNPDIQITRHAVSIDERRAFFRANLFAVPEGRDIKQVWFAGVHCDVGGGYNEEESGLSKIALKWMIEEPKRANFYSIRCSNPIFSAATNQDLQSPTPPARCMSLSLGNGGLLSLCLSVTMTEEPTAKRGVSASFGGEISVSDLSFMILFGRFRIIDSFLLTQ